MLDNEGAPEVPEDGDGYDIMDLATFLEFAIQATHCLEVLNKHGIIHREVRGNAFHLNAHTGAVRFVHFGNRAISLENYGSPSSLVLTTIEESRKRKVKEALCYLAPEQTGSVETNTQDHRTDLYSLGILFWTLLVGHGQMPFEGSSFELMHSIVQKRPMPVHEVRRDVPQVLANIVDKLLAKNPDLRYQSAQGLKTDLAECHRRLLATINSPSEPQHELIPLFDIALQDRFMEFTLPIALYGRDKELCVIRNIIRNTSTSFSQHFPVATSGGHHDTGTSAYDDSSDTTLSRSSALDNSTNPLIKSSDSGEDHRPAAAHDQLKIPKVVIVAGSAGIGKSSMILNHQAKWRSHGLWGQAKFQSVDFAPFAAMLGCMSSVLRQLMVFHIDLQRFVDNLKERLGPQICNVPLLFQAVPELQDVLRQYNIDLNVLPQERLATRDLRTRFQFLVQHVFAVIAETRLFALFLDDLHDADESTLELVSALINSKSRMLIFITLRSDKTQVCERVRKMFSSKSRFTWINVEPLSHSAISSLISKTLRRSEDECEALSTFITRASSGNAFSVKNILTTLQRQHHITFNLERNHWEYDMKAIEESMIGQKTSDPTDLTFLCEHMRSLPEEARRYLIWAVFFGETFKVTDVASMMDLDDSSDSRGDEETNHRRDLQKAVTHLENVDSNFTRSSMRGLQLALSEGWLIQRARDMCSFTHDRYRQAAQAEMESLPPDITANMSFRIIVTMLHENPSDIYRIAEYARRCLSLLRDHFQRDTLLGVLVNAGEAAWARGAHELAIQSFVCARSLFCENPWLGDPDRVFKILERLISLYRWKGDLNSSDDIIQECLQHVTRVEDKCVLLRARSKNHWIRGQTTEAFSDILLALRMLGIDLNPSPTACDIDTAFQQVKNEILSIGFGEILSIPRSRDVKIELAVALLNDAGMNAHLSSDSAALMDMVGLKCIQIILTGGMVPGVASGIFWTVPGTAERRGLYRFAVDLGRLALEIADRRGTMGEKCRVQVLFCSLVSGFDQIHLKSNLDRLEEAVQYGETAGDRLYTNLAGIHSICVRLYICEHLSDLVTSAEAIANDVDQWLPQRESKILVMGILNCIRVYGGYNESDDPATLFDTDGFVEQEFFGQETSESDAFAITWYNSFKVASYYCIGHVDEAVSLGFAVFNTREAHPGHRHTRYGIFFHSLAMVACLRRRVPGDLREKYIKQIESNQKFLRRWLSPSPTNASIWIALVDAELSSYLGNPKAFRLYDLAVRLAMENNWFLEEGWGLFLQGGHYSRCGIEGLGQELQQRGISRQAQWGAQGIAKHMTKMVGIKPQQSLKRSLFTTDIGIQTEVPVGDIAGLSQVKASRAVSRNGKKLDLDASDLGSILKWSTDIASDINLFFALRRLTEIATETSESQNACVAIALDGGEYTIATSMKPPSTCVVPEHPQSIRAIDDPLSRAIIQHAINTREKIVYDDASNDPRFSSEAGQSEHKSVLCLPIISNRDQTLGAAYFASKFPFSKHIVTMLTLLCQQASISISNALYFRSVQAGTRENLKMIAAQRDSLEDARRSREDALKATKTKSNFLASMSHELRTPFSSFYGLLDLLSGTELNPGQSEIVQTAKQSCEQLLKIIDSILDYSKLEASAVKLEPSGFAFENIIADCMELLLPMAAKKLDLSYNIEPDVPEWIYADNARISQVLMNLIGNAIKFTTRGYVRVNVSVEESPPGTTPENATLIKVDITDTGIGLASTDVALLFVPFQQADNSSTRRFGGTGLGLSISRQLIKLMDGAIGVSSELNVGSRFWFNMPVKPYSSEESRNAIAELQQLKTNLNKNRPLEMLVYSPSEATVRYLNTILSGSHISSTTSTSVLRDQIYAYATARIPIDFIVLDDQTEGGAERLIQELEIIGYFETRVIHLHTPMIGQLGQPVFPLDKHPNIFRLTKPPRKSRILQAIAELKNVPNKLSTMPAFELPKAEEALLAQRTLYGNVLIAEDNPIAQSLLVKQLERQDLTVTATNNGEEAIAEWEKHDPGYFQVALFDHHMPVCDGVEATKRLRVLENKRKAQFLLPIVALSADCQEVTKQLCLSAGMNAFFTKPMKKSDLFTLLSMFGSGHNNSES
ncbi:hypothetical protein Agabi119p4_714 [Agaricus bisporus var. burnettii]|uniref:histidine kinase n=1 Tax=Agaricus bisporus var. burnettii TaxID=192524 RepID=A0A8H7FB91_AGABI|nr:hypothetical protein Agabi119p4_714 [Agaricus bisporus var. burnettii]